MMKIKNIKVTPVNIPLEVPMLWTGGYYPGTSKAIIEVETDEGVVGLGESPSAHLAQVVKDLAPRLIGMDPLDVAGICTAAYLHMTAAMPWMHEPSQSLFRWQIADVIQGGPFRQTNNVISVPEGSGLGVELDQAGLNRWHQHYLKHGPLDHFYNPDRPGSFKRLPLN
jgi:L-alanine-DL-glutamate epimerase-like enolase superfamily enzyme